MCIAFIVLFLENIKLFYVLRGFLMFLCIYIEILADSKLCKCLKAIKCSESRVKKLQIFHFVAATFGAFLFILSHFHPPFVSSLFFSPQHICKTFFDIQYFSSLLLCNVLPMMQFYFYKCVQTVVFMPGNSLWYKHSHIISFGMHSFFQLTSNTVSLLGKIKKFHF